MTLLLLELTGLVSFVAAVPGLECDAVLALCPLGTLLVCYIDLWGILRHPVPVISGLQVW